MQETDTKINCHQIVRASLLHGRCEIDSLPRSLPEFLKPGFRIRAMNHPPQKTQPFGCIVAISSNVVLGDLGVEGKKAVHASGLAEDVSRVAQLRSFDDDGFLYIENVFVAKQIGPECPA